MRWLRVTGLRFRSLFRRDRVESELDRELRYHLERLVEQNRESGMSDSEARRAALAELGGIDLAKEQCRDTRRTRWLENAATDFVHSLRQIRRQPGFALTVALTLGLGIGANTVLYSVADALLRKGTPFPEPDRLIMVLESRVEEPDNWIPVSPGNYRDWRAMSRSFSHLGVYLSGSANLTEAEGHAGDAERLSAARVDEGFFPAMGVEAAMGRTLDSRDMAQGTDRAVVISHGLWQRRFGSDANVVGKGLLMNGAHYQVAGVMPREFTFPAGVDVWQPLAWTENQWAARPRPMMFAVGRLRTGVSGKQALAEMNTLAVNLEKAHPDTNTGWRVTFVPIEEFPLGEDIRRYGLLLAGVVGLVLLIGCANVANLLLTRITGRVREIALRHSLGASRARLTQQLLTESLSLSFLGAVLGIAAASAAVPVLRAAMPSDVARELSGWELIQVDGRVAGFGLLLAVLTGLLAGFAPVWLALRQHPGEHLAGAVRSTGDRRRVQLRNWLVATEIALAVPLLVGALLMVRGFLDIWNRDQGYRAESLLTFRVDLPPSRYAKPEQVARFYEELLDRLRVLPGVQGVFASNAIPHSGRGPAIRYFSREGDPSRAPGDRPLVVLQAASPGYLQSMRIPLKLGRDLAASDDTRAPLVAMISARLAKDFWPDEDPIGRRLKLGDAQDASRPWLTVVGVTGDVLHDSLGNGPQSTVYLPLAQATLRDMHVGIRALGQPEMLARAARREVQALDRDLPIYQVRTMEGIREAALIGVRGMAWVMGALSVLALLVAAIGVYSMMAYAVAERTREFGIRVAVGATSGGLMAEVLRRGLNVAIGGALAGLCLAGAASRLIGTAIAGMAKADSLTFAVVAGAMTIAAIAASIAPARRATQVDPVVALRAE